MLLGLTPLAVAVRKRFVIPGPLLPATNLLTNGDFEAGNASFTPQGYISFSSGQAVIWDQFGDADLQHYAIYWTGVVAQGSHYDVVVDVASKVTGTLGVMAGVGSAGMIGSAQTVAPGVMTFPNILVSGSTNTNFGIVVSTNARFTLNGVYLNPAA